MEHTQYTNMKADDILQVLALEHTDDMTEYFDDIYDECVDVAELVYPDFNQKIRFEVANKLVLIYILKQQHNEKQNGRIPKDISTNE